MKITNSQELRCHNLQQGDDLHFTTQWGVLAGYVGGSHVNMVGIQNNKVLFDWLGIPERHWFAAKIWSVESSAMNHGSSWPTLRDRDVTLGELTDLLLVLFEHLEGVPDTRGLFPSGPPPGPALDPQQVDPRMGDWTQTAMNQPLYNTGMAHPYTLSMTDGSQHRAYRDAAPSLPRQDNRGVGRGQQSGPDTSPTARQDRIERILGRDVARRLMRGG